MNTLTDAQLVVSADVAALLDRFGPDRAQADPAAAVAPGSEEEAAIAVLYENGFLVDDRESEQRALAEYFHSIKHDTGELNITLLTTLQCNFACDYCFQGDHGDYNKFAEKMSLETADRVGDWIEGELDRIRPEKFLLTFFGGEPLLNLPVMYALAERMWHAARRRGVQFSISIITNGLLLTDDVVDRMLPFGLRGVKITLDGDRDTHDRMRPLRGGQGTFDRIIENIRRVAGRCNIAIGGNFDESSVDSYPALLDFLRGQEFADKLIKVNFKPVVRGNPANAAAAVPSRAALKGILPLTPVGSDGRPLNSLNGTCMTSAGAGGGATCDTCDFVDDKMTFLREETRKRGFPTPDGVHNGPCHVHISHAHTIGPDGSLYACPGFTGEKARSIGHIDQRLEAHREAARREFDRLSPWKACGDCAFIPVCAGGCVAASHSTLGDMHTPTCHKRSYESAVVSLAHSVAGVA